ncbi:MAG: hypothetical protein V4702_02080 [Patescibacteria group bacterium]
MATVIKRFWASGLLIVLAVSAIGARVVVQQLPVKTSVPASIVSCAHQANDFDCWKERYKAMVEQDSPKAAFADLRQSYESSDYVRSQCHQIVHVIGRTAAAKYSDTVSAYDQGDNFCWSGYYHGVMEGVADKLGADEVMATMTTICESAKQKSPYGFYHFNCVHGLGHGLMAINGDELFDVLELCRKFSDQWERESCYGGTFMENIMSSQNARHSTKYIKPDDALYPCTAVDVEFKQQCYLMQTSHALQVENGDFEKVFVLCAGVEAPLDVICYQSLGRDASGRSISNVASTKTTCLLGQSDTAQSNCVIGAVKDFISYFHSDKQGMELCKSFDSPSLSATCTSTAQQYYSTF